VDDGYYRDRRTGAILSIRELTRLALREGLTRERRGERFAPVPPASGRAIGPSGDGPAPDRPA
jgi:hypothetical protein